jgi:hypothetical protein
MRRLEQIVLGVLSLTIALALWRPSPKLEGAPPSLLLYLVALPLVFYVLLRFAYWTFVRPYLRFLRIRRYRNNKELREAAKRSL